MSHPPGGSFAVMGNQEEIDLVEFLGFLWRVRNYALVGAVAGLAVGGLAALRFLPTSYSSQLSVSLDARSFPAISDPKKVIEAYASALSSADLAAAAFRLVLRVAPAFEKSLGAQGVSLEGLIADQALSDKPIAVPLRLVQSLSAQDYVIEAKFPVSGLGEKAPVILLAALNEVATKSNERAVQHKAESARNLVAEARAVTESDSGYAKNQVDYETEILKIRTDLGRLEYRLLKKARAAGIDASFFNVPQQPRTTVSFPMTAVKAENGIQAIANPGANLDLDRRLPTDKVLSMISALAEDNRISTQETASIQREIADLQHRFSKAQALYSSVVSANRAIQDSIYQSMQSAVVPVERSSQFLPLLRMNDDLQNSALASSKMERKSNKRSVAVFAGGFLGLVLGALTGGLRLFIRKNREKFRQVAYDGDPA